MTGTLIFVPGETTKVVRVDLLNCDLSTKIGFRSFTFNLSTPVNGTIVRASTRVDIVGDGDLTTTPDLYVRDATVDHDAGTIEVPVLLGGPAGTASNSTVTVHYATHDGTALAGTDYTSTSGTLTFGPGETAENVTVPIIDRTGTAPTRRFTVTLSSPTAATIVDGTGVVTIGASGATPLALPDISAPPDVVVGEADGYVTLPVTLSAPGTKTVSVKYQTTNSTALSSTGCDYNYVGVSGTLIFVPGETTEVVRVDLLNCDLSTKIGFRSFTFNLSTPVNGTIVRASTRVDIVGDGDLTTTPDLYVRDATVDHDAGTIEVPVLLGGPVGHRLQQHGDRPLRHPRRDGPGRHRLHLDQRHLDLRSRRDGRERHRAHHRPHGHSPHPALHRDTVQPDSRHHRGRHRGGHHRGQRRHPAGPARHLGPARRGGRRGRRLRHLPVTLSAPGTKTVSVKYTTANGTALSSTGCDYNYVGVTGTLIYVPGETTEVVRVDLLNCDLASPGTFKLELSTAVNGTILRSTVTINLVETPSVPDAPTDVSAVAGNHSATVYFSTPSSDGGLPINTYTVTAEPGGATASGPGPWITVTGLTDGVTYRFTVTATNTVGTGPASIPSNVVVPTAPSFSVTTKSLACRHRGRRLRRQPLGQRRHRPLHLVDLHGIVARRPDAGRHNRGHHRYADPRRHSDLHRQGH